MWIAFASSPDGPMETMQGAYLISSEEHKGYEDVLADTEREYGVSSEHARQVRALTLEYHQKTLNRIEGLEVEAMRLHPGDQPLITLVKGRQAERTAVALVGLRDFFTNEAVLDVKVATLPPSAPAVPTASSGSPSYILAKDVVFECERLRMAFNEAEVLGEALAYTHLSNVMTEFFDDSGRYADFDSYDAKIALEECGQ